MKFEGYDFDWVHRDGYVVGLLISSESSRFLLGGMCRATLQADRFANPEVLLENLIRKLSYLTC